MFFTVLVPLVVGKLLLEYNASAREYANAHKVGLGLTSNSMLIMIVWQSLSKSRSELVGQVNNNERKYKEKRIGRLIF